MRKTRKEVQLIFLILSAFFLLFLFIPLGKLFIQALAGEKGWSVDLLGKILSSKELHEAFLGSITLSLQTSVLATLIGFLFAYAVNFTNLFKPYKRLIEVLISLPMLLPTIVYGFALIYSFGKQGIITKILGFQIFDIYSPTGLLLGFLIYTVPISFLLLNNAMKYIDCQFFIVSELMGDNPRKKFLQTIFLPLLTTIGVSVVQTFFLSFTDFGLPASIAGTRPLIASMLYNQMVGSVPDFARGAIVALAMLFPALLTSGLLIYLQRFCVKYDKITTVILKKNHVRDTFFSLVTALPILFLLITFLSVFIVPFVESYPYNLTVSMEHFFSAFTESDVLDVYRHSLLLSVLTGVFGVILCFTAALLARRSSLGKLGRGMIEILAQVTTAIPGMVLGIAFLFAFSGTALHYTLAILVFANLVHFFATPFAMATQALEKLSAHYERTASLLGDSYLKTLGRIILPNTKKTLIEMFSYLFINSMVTISALIFLVGAETTTLTTKIKELQHFNKFSEIFILALLLLITNLFVKVILSLVLQGVRLPKIKTKDTKFFKVQTSTQIGDEYI